MSSTPRHTGDDDMRTGSDLPALASLVRGGRFVWIVPSITLYAVAVGLIAAGVIEVVETYADWIAGELTRKEVLLDFTEVVDTFLLASVAYVINLGLLYLFVTERAPLPKWLRLSGLDDLKEKLISVVVAALAVGFLGSSIRLGASMELLYAGAAAALVIAALGLFLRLTPGDKE
jgi:uncharacterized membrane protein YqhA